MTKDSLFTDLTEADQETLSGGVLLVQFVGALGSIRSVLSSVALPSALNAAVTARLQSFFSFL